MDFGKHKWGARKLAAVLLLCVGPLVAGCMPDSPETALSWNVDDTVAVRRHQPTRTYVYQDKGVSYDNEAASPPVPTPRPSSSVQAYAPQPRPAPHYESGDVAFAWPVSGSIISGFGALQNGERNDGINIAARMDTPIRASASGTVSYAGNELKGYGNLLLIKHQAGYVTAYAHADRLLVNRGDTVTKGQVIGYCGQTGDVTSPQLHFEIRRDTTPVDPRSFLSARAGA